jgi:ribosomal protein S13
MLSSKLGCVRKTKLGFIKSRKRKIISRYIDAHYSTENLLRRKVRIILRNHLIHGSYKGIRFRQGFPVNGQRTRSNAQTSRKRLLLKELKINIK